MGAYFGAGTLAGADGKTAQIPDAWKAAWKYYYDAIWTDHVEHDRAAVREPGHQPQGLPVLHRQDRDERELPVVDLRPRRTSRATGTWRAIPSYNGKATAAFNADTFRILKGTKHPDEAFEVLTYLLGDARPGPARGLRRHPRPDRRPGGLLRRAQDADSPRSRRLAGRHRRHPVRRQPELRVVHARLQRDPRPRRLGRQVPDQVADRPGPRHGPGVRRRCRPRSRRSGTST